MAVGLLMNLKVNFISLEVNTYSGQNLIDSFSRSINLASKNAPAVVFIDDVDVLFQHDDTYRAFLTILDGL